jgi:hypothetical protein
MADTKNTVEELFKKSSELLENQVRIPIIFKKLASRGYTPTTEEEAIELLKVANEIGQRVLNGEIDPIPASALEKDGSLSKHASAAAQEDMLHFAPDMQVDITKVDPAVKTAAAVCTLVGMAQG